MTTIAFDGRYLASDSQATGGHIIGKVLQKIHIVDNEYVVAFSGDRDQQNFIINNNLCDIRDQKIIKLINEGIKDKNDGEHTISILLIPIDDPSMGRAFTNGVVYSWSIGDMYSMGSGANIASGAMKAESTAIEAVRIASELDIYTDANIQFYDFETMELNLKCLEPKKHFQNLPEIFTKFTGKKQP